MRPNAFICVFLALTLAGGCSENNSKPADANSGDYHKHIKSWEEKSLLYHVPVFDFSLGHYSVNLKIDGVQFRDVAGMSPWYFDIPQYQRIIFATKRASGASSLHVYDFKLGRDIPFDAVTIVSHLGNRIGGSSAQGGLRLESCTDDGIVLLEPTSDDYWTKIVLNLKQGRIARVDQMMIDRKKSPLAAEKPIFSSTNSHIYIH